jgi:adenosine deaminase
MIRERMSVTLCTDNRLVSRTDSTTELEKAVNAFHLQPNELRGVILHGFKRSFYAGSYREKRAYVRQVIDYYDKVAARFGLVAPRRGDSP